VLIKVGNNGCILPLVTIYALRHQLSCIRDFLMDKKSVPGYWTTFYIICLHIDYREGVAEFLYLAIEEVVYVPNKSQIFLVVKFWPARPVL